jgi:hypothetical protein
VRSALALATSVLLALVAGCAGNPDRRPAPHPSADLSASPPAVATSRGPFAAGPVAAPATGALLGSWVRPGALTQPGRIEAIRSWEATLGRPLAITHTYKRLDEPFFTDSDTTFGARSTLMLSWAGGDSRSVVAGRHDTLIRERARQVRDFGKPLLLRYRWEMDRPNLRATMWSPADYIAMWKHVRSIFAAEGVRNASWVWCPTIEGFERGDAPSFYPGDDMVDWLCVDVYSGSRFVPLGEHLRPFFHWTSTHPDKPVMIGEFGVARAWRSEQRAGWIRNGAAVFKANPQVKAVLYFESDPDDRKPDGMFSIADDPAALAAFIELANDPYFNPKRG